MIIDFHTHIFPPRVRDEREDYLRRDATFAEMYADPKAKIAVADDLLEQMESAGVDVSVALGFAWSDAGTCAEHNDYLLESAAKSNGRIVAFCTLNPAHDSAEEEAVRCARAGAKGLGELRPDNQGWDPAGDAGEALAEVGRREGLTLLFHVSEPVGREYPGKKGGALADFDDFAQRHSDVSIVGAHLAGGLPFYAMMPEVREMFSHVYVDTAAQRLLYDDASLEYLVRLIGAERILLGSDYPLVMQARQIEELRSGVFRSSDVELMLGGNAQKLLGLETAN